MLVEWIGKTTPRLHAHALINRHDGRTLSYAYIEVSPELSKGILRARQNSILGKGKRARAVTVTHSSQMDLMREVCYMLLLYLYASTHNCTDLSQLEWSVHGQ